MKHEALCETVCRLNLDIVEAGLVVLTWGNASVADRDEGVMAIKPSGVEYAKLSPKDIVVLDIATGEQVHGELKPSSDTPTHLVLYREVPGIHAVVHTHSTYATAWAQAGKPLPCFGTTHADHFYGEVPVARALTAEEIRDAYEHNTGVAIVETFRDQGLDPLRRSAVLLPGHGPFAWGDTAEHALENAIVLEEVALMATLTLSIAPGREPLPQGLLDKHFLRKHGAGAYYGQG